MRKTLFWAALAAAVVLAASCASTPPKSPEPQVVQVEPEKPVVPAPAAELAKAKELKHRADAYDLGQYAPEEYAAAVKDLAAGEAAYGKDNAAAKKSLDKAVAGFTDVIATGGAVLVDRIQFESESSKQAADEAKAPVAVKDEYAAALALYNGALAAKKAGDLEKAGSDFAAARDGFDAAAATARDKREKALQAMQETEDAMAASEQDAADAQQALDSEGIPVQAGGN